MINPHYCYIVAFLLALITYQFRWSEYFPALGLPLVLFLIATIVLNFIIGRSPKWKRLTEFRKVSFDKVLIWVTITIYMLWSVEFIYEGGVPIFKILLGSDYDYRQFGVPTLHVIIVTFSSFFTTYLLHVYLSTKKKTALAIYIINLLAAFLIINRGMLLLNICSGIFIFLFSLKKIDLKTLIKLASTSLLILALFGVLGHLRVSNLLHRFYDRSIVYEIGHANDSFKENAVPSEFFWTYLYIASPLANLQFNIDHADPGDFRTMNFLSFVNSEWLPDFISKRINRITGGARKKPSLIADHLNASTVYSRAYSYLGWTGMFLVVLMIFFFARFYIKLLPTDSPFFLTCIATLNSLYFFLIFDNFFVFSGFSFQLVYPFVFALLERKQILTLTPKSL